VNGAGVVLAFFGTGSLPFPFSGFQGAVCCIRMHVTAGLVPTCRHHRAAPLNSHWGTSIFDCFRDHRAVGAA
jgi:hypothetical protein